MLVGLKIDVGILSVAACIAKGGHLFEHICGLVEWLNQLFALKLIGIEGIAVGYPLLVFASNLLPISHLQSIVTAPTRNREGH